MIPSRAKPVCLVLTFNHNVAPEPHPTVLGKKLWTCPRCGREFNEEHPTQQFQDRCVFDKEA